MMEDFYGSGIDMFLFWWQKRDETHSQGEFGQGLRAACKQGNNCNQAWLHVKKFLLAQDSPPKEWFVDIDGYYLENWREFITRDYCLFLVKRYHK